MGLFSWKENNSGGIVAPDERLPYGATVAMGIQHVIAMFGATVLAPILMGFDPNVAILMSGIGTLIFFFVVGGKVPSYLGSSFAFISPVFAVLARPELGGYAAAQGGFIAFGLFFVLVSQVVRVAGTYFGFRPDANDRVLAGDGRALLEREKGPWDAIFLDAYFSDSVPFHLTTREFFELCRARLSPDGVFAGNFVGRVMGRDQRLFWAVVRTAQEVFPTVVVLSRELAEGKSTFSGNAILVATASPDRLSRERVYAEGDRLAAALGHPPVADWARTYHEGELKTADVPVLTDSYSPTDALQHLGR